MPRNSLAGTKKGKSKSAVYFQNNPVAKAKKKAYDTEYNASPSQRKKRSELVKINRDKGNYGNLDGKDEAHVSKKKTKLQSQSKNRADKSKNFFGKKKKK
jgi:hypothetical protein